MVWAATCRVMGPGFVMLQLAVDKAIINLKSSSVNLTEIAVRVLNQAANMNGASNASALVSKFLAVVPGGVDALTNLTVGEQYVPQARDLRSRNLPLLCCSCCAVAGHGVLPLSHNAAH
jgi:hypothetical protein